MNFIFRKATKEDTLPIWAILKLAIQRRKEEGSKQWQDGYPNLEIVQKDIENGAGFVLVDNDAIVGYCSILINDEPAYDEIEGKWITTGDFVVFHRVALNEKYIGKGLAQKMIGYIEDFALQNNILSVKADTNFDNLAMLKIFKKLDFVYCGEVYFRGSARKAFEKVLEKQ